MTFEIRNAGQETYRLLTWDLPLEDEPLNFLTVTRDGNDIAYDGKLLRRGSPLAKEYINLAPGASKSVEVDISRIYPVQAPGEYTVTLNATVHDVYAIAEDAAPTHALDEFEPLPLAETSVSFTLSRGDPPRMTIGQAIRLEEPPLSAERAATPFLEGGTPTQRNDTISAHNRAASLARRAGDRLRGNNPDSLYYRWFGANGQAVPPYPPTLRDLVDGNYYTIANRLDGFPPVVYNLQMIDCTPNVHAWTVVNSGKVFLCKPFLDAPVYPGFFCKSMTLVHEWVHAACGIAGDPASGESACLNLARTNPRKAIFNPDNYAGFVNEL
ncbi:M35 family metallo-endopeptidase [Streptomyces griseosporeus]|uniref:M35 family metallo-endopeptidase n=1 Tax=Streptomyces griseosporeus TaxID=1910 RepID=UPI00167F170E|nr:M35 family metallo-endopeptidase [Streptomyces griseosporeus]